MNANLSSDSGSLHGTDRVGRMLAAFPAGMGVVGLDLRWREANPALGRLFACAPEALAGQPLFGRVHEDDNPVFQQRLRALAQGHRDADRTTLRLRRADGSLFPAEVLLGLMRDTGGAPEALLVEVRDRSEAVAAQAALEASQRQLQLITDAVSHDLRAPLRSIESFAARLAERNGDALDAAGRDHLARIRAAAGRMGGLLRSLGELVRAMRAEVKPQPVDIGLVAEWAWMTLRERDPQRDAELDLQPDLRAHGDERLLQLLFVQLLDNAWRYAKPDAPVRVAVRGERRGDRLHLRIRDEGSGFDMRYAHKLFEPFQRLHGPEQGGGHGLGLAIAQRVVERHGGRIRAESAPEAGSTLHVELPAPSRDTDAPA